MARIALGEKARAVEAMTSDTSGVWAVTERPGGLLDELVRIDPATNGIAARVQVGLRSSGVAADADAVWVANVSGACVAYSCSHGSAYPPPKGPGFPQENSVYRIDPDSGDVVARIPMASPGAVVVGGGAVWVGGSGKVFRIDRQTNRVTATIPVLPETSLGFTLAFGAGSLWAYRGVSEVGKPASTVVYRIDPRQNAVVATIPIAMGFGAIAVDGDAVWVAPGGSARTLVRIDPAKNGIGREVPYGDYTSATGDPGAAQGLALLGSHIWFGTPTGIVRIVEHADGYGGSAIETTPGVISADGSAVWIGAGQEVLRFAP